jgi:hypothetical protein
LAEELLRTTCEDIDLQRVKLFRVEHEECGQRWLILNHAQIEAGSDAFVEYVEDTTPDVPETRELARAIVINRARRFAHDPMFLQAADTPDGEGTIDIMYLAAAFLLTCGITDVDQITTNINLTWLDS